MFPSLAFSLGRGHGLCRFKTYILDENATLRWSTRHCALHFFLFNPPPLSCAPARRVLRPPDATPLVGVLSVLGAKGGADPSAEVAGKIQETGYVRVDKAWKILFPILNDRNQNMSLSLSESGK